MDLLNNYLNQIRNGELMAVGVLADWLEETGHPQAKAVRKLWTRFEERARYFATCDTSRWRRWTRCEAIADDLALLRWKVRKLFGRSWGSLMLRGKKYERWNMKAAAAIVKQYALKQEG